MWAPVQRADRLPRKTKKALARNERIAAGAIAWIRSEREAVMRLAWERLAARSFASRHLVSARHMNGMRDRHAALATMMPMEIR